MSVSCLFSENEYALRAASMNVSGALTAGTLSAGSISLASVAVSGNASIGGTTTAAAVSCTTLAASGAAVMGSTLAVTGAAVMGSTLAVTGATTLSGAVALPGLAADNTLTKSVCVSDSAAASTKVSAEGGYVPVWTWAGLAPASASGIYMRSGGSCQVIATFTGVAIAAGSGYTATITLPFARTGNFAGLASELAGVVTSSNVEAIGVIRITPTTGAQTASIYVELKSSVVATTTVNVTASFIYNGIA